MAELLTSEDPERIAGYWLAARLGAGGQGTVYEAYDEAGQRVAVKVLRPELVARPDIAGRFAKEVLAAQRVESFCTARVLESGTDGERPYIVSEFVPGRDLRKAVRDSGPLTGDALVRLATGAATALAAIHRAGVVHRDLKPDNVLLGPDGPRVIDFGIARTADMSLTDTGHLMGTPGYMAPEVLTGRRADGAADVFAWGAVMLFAATGRDPFRGENIGEVVVRVTEHHPDLTPLPPALRELVGEALAKAPADRPTATALLLRMLGGPADAADAALLAAGRENAGRLRDATADAAEPALGAAAETTYQRLPEPVQQAVREIALRLIVPGAAVDGSQDTLRTAATAEWLEGRPYEERSALRDAFGSLAGARLLVLEDDAARLASLGLLRAWPRLRDWVDDDREALLLLRWLTAAAGHWDGQGRRAEDLPAGSAPEAARACVAGAPGRHRASRLEGAFLEACRQAAAARRRRTRRLRAGAAALLSLALVAGLVAWQQKGVSDERARQASARTMASIAESLRTSDPEMAALLSVAAWRIAPVDDARAALYGSLGQDERGVVNNLAKVSTGFYDDHADILLDGRTLAVFDAQTSVEVWDVVSGKRTGRADLPEGTPDMPPAVDPTGAVAAQPMSRGVRLIDLKTGEAGPLLLPDGPTPKVVAMAREAAWVAVTTTVPDEALLVDGRSGRPVLRTPGDGAVALSQDGATYAHCPAGRPVQLYSTATGQTVELRREPPYPTITCGQGQSLAFSADGKRLIHTGTGATSTLWDVSSRTAVRWFGAGSVAALSPDGALAVEVTETQLKVWADSGTSTSSVLFGYPRLDTDSRGMNLSVAFDADSRLLRYVARDRQVRSLDLTYGLQDAAAKANVPEAVFAPDAATLATVGATDSDAEDRFRLWSTADGQERRLPHHPVMSSIADADDRDDDGASAYSGDGGLLATSSWHVDGKPRVTVWDTRENRLRTELTLPEPLVSVRGFAFTPDGTRLAVAVTEHDGSASITRALQLWDLGSGRLEYTIADVGAANLAISPDGSLLVTSAGERVDLATRAVERGVLGPGVIQDLEFSDDGSVLAVSLLQGTVTLWDGEGRRRLGGLSSTAATRGDDFGGRVAGLRFSHDGKTLAAIVGDSRIQLWDVPARRRLGDPLRGSAGLLRALAFDSRGRLHVSSSKHPHRVFDLEPKTVARVLCERVGRDLTRAQWEQNVPDLPYRSVC
ncbi:WD40 repeat domain-containing serine/threonine-protein kinase [Streptomyces sp. NBC_01214]|uniref:WD40 repeat domain-containing serine/threonine protein kinase n=1 Tax=Streptomyces sp. NBC_01214 TaxID=2903777 RepID=UPI002255C264|nr:WD40 repeat domain-containing serine/threonine-protein kinase [Streptomyces sp. NBC_01214]MCX4803791.1 WD40 repeat domain-containing serine/threonine-protein kinase [Streptomyces sp. NBC_01214]